MGEPKSCFTCLNNINGGLCSIGVTNCHNYSMWSSRVLVQGIRTLQENTRQTIEQLQARVAELEAANARCLERHSDTSILQETEKELFIAQADNKRLRDALESCLTPCVATVYQKVTEALDQPSDTSALDTYVAEKVNEIIESHAPEGRNFTNEQVVDMRHKLLEKIEQLTRQRDLAVEALECSVEDLKGGFVACEHCGSQESTATLDVVEIMEDALSTIKESEGK